ncbi:MAG: GT4 family glycosyltransferase PelF [Candidatus Omnitrophica bacterium]|nr:GT4 family glycosyltransferase PelF [Candidatus Omnitrophota bacterium]
MNILQILPELNVGGVETGTVDFSKYLKDHGHKSVVISNGGRLVDELEKSGTVHYTLPVHKKSLPVIWRMVKAVREIILKEEIEIVHARSRVPAWIAFFACRKTPASFITTCHGYYKNKFFSQVMGWSKQVIVPSAAIGRHMVDDYGVPPSSIRCVPRSVNLDKFNVKRKLPKGSARANVAIIGRVTPLKGHTYFLNAMAKVVRNVNYAKIWIIGDVPPKKEEYRRELQLLVKRLGLSANVEFLGNRSDVPELLAECDVVVLSTITPESFGRVILEAQAVGVPVVAPQVGGVVDIIDHEETGLLVLPKDTEAMAQAVLRLLKDKKLTERMVKAAKKKIEEKFLIKHMAEQTLQVYEDLRNDLNILVIKISSIGDVILVVPSLKAIRKKFPKAHLYVLVGEEGRKILHNCPYVDGLIVYDHKNKDKKWWNFLRLVNKLRRHKFDKILDFQNSRKSHWLCFLSLPQESYGFDNKKWSFLLSNPVKNYKNDIPPVRHQFQILEQIGIKYDKKVHLELWPKAQDADYASGLLDSEWLGNAKQIVGINLSASEKWETKNWPKDYIVRLCDMLGAKNIRVLLTGMEKDKEAAVYVKKHAKSRPSAFIGKTDILQLAALIKRCSVYVTPDSAPLHIAASMRVPVVTFFGPTSSVRHLPPGDSIVVMERVMDCAPCYSPKCRIGTHACMKEISPEDVFQEIYRLIGKTK